MTGQTIETGFAAFKPRARLLKLIGSELISNEVMALAELVKNAHDADAGCVIIEFNAASAPSGEIVIRDDGCGISLETLLENWMQPAGSSKRGKDRTRSPRGRRMLGEKGVGRFAVDKLGRYLELTSRPEGSDHEVHAIFDWDRFDDDSQLLSDIENRYEVRSAGTGKRHGTELRIRGLRTAWTERMFKRLTTRLSRLRSPFNDVDPFTIYIKSDEYPSYTGELRPGLLDRAPYRLDATFNGRRTVNISLNGEPVEEYELDGEPFQCGPVRIRLYAFDLEADALARLGPRMEARAWLKECSGISLFRDGFRVWPYGEPQDDWLRLDQRRVNNPTLRLSNNQVVGFVEITGDLNSELRDQTNREGLIQNEAFEHLRILVHRVLNVLETDRLARRHPKASRATSVEQTSAQDSVTDAIEALVAKAEQSSPELARELRGLAKRTRSLLEAEKSRQKKMTETYADLAAAGQMAISYVPALARTLEKMRAGFHGLRSASSTGPAPSLIVDDLDSAIDFMEEQLESIAPPSTASRERRRTIDLIRELRIAQQKLAPLFDRHRAEMFELSVPETGAMRTEMAPESFQRVLHLLAENSLEASHEPCVKIEARQDGTFWVLEIVDSGPGIAPALEDHVFAPFFTTKEGHLGMGLTLARNLLEIANASIEIASGDAPGTRLVLRFEQKRS